MKLKGFSLIELMIAGAVFVVFATGVIEVLLYGLETDRLSGDRVVGTAYATAGIEAVHAIKAKNFDDLILTEATGLERENDNWVFAGTENVDGIFTRTLAIREVNRNWDGVIDERGGFDADPDTKKVTVTVSWNVTPFRSHSVVLDTFLTRWK